MKRERFTEERTIGVLEEAAASAKTLDRLKRLVADLTLDNRALKGLLGENF